MEVKASQSYLKDSSSSMVALLEIHGTEYPILASVMHRLLMAVMSTADCERGFSVLKLTKTALRNRLGEENLNNAMVCYIEGPSEKDLDLKPVKSRFIKNGNKKRRVTK